jgi:hypothetical protein
MTTNADPAVEPVQGLPRPYLLLGGAAEDRFGKWQPVDRDAGRTAEAERTLQPESRTITRAEVYAARGPGRAFQPPGRRSRRPGSITTSGGYDDLPDDAADIAYP